MPPPYVAGIGPYSPKLMIIGEAPGKHESEQGKPFVGPTGQMLDEMLQIAGISRSECYITNVVKYQPPFNDMSKLHLIGVDLEQSKRELWENEINQRHPNCILAIGDHALNAVTGLEGILNYRGSILTAKDGKTKVVPTIHPAALFSRYQAGEDTKGGLDYTYKVLIQHDINRAATEASSPDIRLPDRVLSVCHNSLDLFRYIREYDKLELVSCDIESVNCIPVCVGFAFSRYHALSVPLLRDLGKNKLTEMGDNELNECWKLIDQVLTTKKIIGHNYKYDDFKLSLFGFWSLNVYSDTLIKTRVLFPELPDKRLSTVSSLWTREPFYKDEGKEFKLGKHDISRLLLYNAKDCAVEFEVDESQEQDLIELGEKYKIPLKEYYYNYMMKKHKFYLKMENNGFRVDFEKKRELHKRYTQMEYEVHSRISEAVGHEVNVKSTPQKYQLLYKEMGFPALKKNPTSEDAIVRLIGNHCKGSTGAAKKSILEDLLEESRIRDQKSRYINFNPDYDGRCKTSFNISATETCRSSTSVLKKPLRPKKIGLAFHTISKHGRLAKDIRSMFIPDKGKVFIQADSSQAEARVVAVLSKDWDLLKAFDRVDIHRRTAGLIFGYSSNLILTDGFIKVIDELAKDGDERFTGKMVRHATNYDMKKNRLMTEFNTAAQKAGKSVSISEWKAGVMLDLMHSASPKIKGVFHYEIQQALLETRCLIDPFGGIRIFNGRMDDSLFGEGYANIPQRTVAHLVQGAALKVDEELNGDLEFMWLSENHDSLLMQVPENNWQPYARLLKKYMEAPIDFSRYCTLKRDFTLVIPADIELSTTNYSEMEKVKL